MPCTAPIYIPNPNYGMDERVPRGLYFLKDTKSAYIPIPCGVCDSCIANKQMQLVQRIQMEALHNHLFMCTLTYNEEMIPRCELSSGRSIRYADVNDVLKMFKRLRKHKLFPRSFRYFLVSERGSEKFRPHFHILFLLPKEKDDNLFTCISIQESLWRIVLDNWTRNVGSRKNPIYKPLCTYRKKYVGGKLYSNYDLHFVDPGLTENGVADVAFYVLKYMTKPSKKERNLQIALKLNLSIDEYERVWPLIRSRWSASLDFGLSKNPIVKEYLRNCIKKTPIDAGYPFYYNSVSGQSFPLAKFYRSKPDIYSVQDALSFYYNGHDEYHDINRDQQIKKWNDFIQKTDISCRRGAAVYFDDLSD